MLNKRSLVITAGVVAISGLLVLVSWSPAPVVAQGPSATLVPPVAVLKVVAVPQSAADKNAITATVKYITDTAVGERTATVAMGTTGLSNVPINVPIHLAASAKDAKNTGKPTWSLTKPTDSKATIQDPTAMETEFTPDVVGAYMVSVSLKGDSGTSAPRFAFFNAGTFIGMDAGNCQQCHPTKVAEWAKTGHAIVFSKSLDNQIFGPGRAGMYAETCLPCHTVGYYVPPIGAGAGGFYEAKAKANWSLPTFKQQDAAFAKTGPSNLDGAPAAVKNMGNIQCEECHGPASEHVKNGAKVMAVSFDNGACNVCHAAGGHHVKGVEIQFSKHSDADSLAWTHPVGPEEQACVRCHSGEGFASFLANPTSQAAWNNEEQAVGCPTCHDPHSDANPYQLRVAGKPVEVPFTAKDVGLSATCEECHNNRSNADAFVKGTPGVSYPHYASDAEMLSDTGGVTYGATVPNSPHGMMVGAAAIPDPADSSGKTLLFKGNVPGPCVTCHMTGGLSDAKDPNYMKVGGHSFNMVSPDGKFDYGAACKSCHGDVKDFNLKAKADYDGNGQVEGVQNEVKGLLGVLWKQLEAKGFKKLDSGYPYATLPQNADDKMKNAWYNFRYVYGVMWGTDGPGNEGKAAAIHNFKRSVSLLQLSIKDLSGALPSGITELK